MNRAFIIGLASLYLATIGAGIPWMIDTNHKARAAKSHVEKLQQRLVADEQIMQSDAAVQQKRLLQLCNVGLVVWTPPPAALRGPFACTP
jgi:hypothetical protein